PAFVKMRENRYGRIVFTTSAAGLYGNFGQTNYSAAKMGLVGFMNTLKLEGDKHNIKVNTVAPIAGTRLTEDVLPPDLFEKLTPEFVAPLVLYLSSEQCPVNGAIYNAGMGYFNRVAILTGTGVVVGDGKEALSLEDVAANMEKIKSLDGAEEFSSAVAAFGPMLDAFSPKKKDEGAGPADTSGDEGGSWHVTVKDGTCEVAEGSHGSPTTTIKMADEDFVKMITGKLNAMSAFTSGKLKIEGDLMKSQLIEKIFKF
ncbi:MAG: SDR family NAD(P)-dependent oxidoreductase, partial [Deltaproteobacteria bacterium]|nr:SDR family NAD(P)-dependent oxidoreductase [Deltaproteobacteria bacterium]